MGLHDNPWNCDCRLKSFRDWALNNKLLGVQPTKCSQPDRLANFEWSQLLTSHFACSPKIDTLQINGQATDAYIVGDVGKTIRLECLVKANPPADVRWVKDTIAMTNGTASAAGKSYFIQVSGDVERWVNLTLTNTHFRDAGDYTCVGENKGHPNFNLTSLTCLSFPYRNVESVNVLLFLSRWKCREKYYVEFWSCAFGSRSWDGNGLRRGAAPQPTLALDSNWHPRSSPDAHHPRHSHRLRLHEEKPKTHERFPNARHQGEAVYTERTHLYLL